MTMLSGFMQVFKSLFEFIKYPVFVLLILFFIFVVAVVFGLFFILLKVKD